MKVVSIVFITLITFIFVINALLGSAEKDRIQLIVFIVVDQLRGDTLEKYKNKFTNNGFNYLLNNGVTFRNAQYSHSATFTSVGHATLSTGAYPSEHGIVGNDWKDMKAGQAVYSVADHKHAILDDNLDQDVNGVSPINLLSTTIGDELILSNNGQSKVFSVSGKDRAAILLGGHLGKAFWYSKKHNNFVTSNYYYKQYPKWFDEWRSNHKISSYIESGWNLIESKDFYENKDNDDREYEKTIGQHSRTFPHILDFNKKTIGTDYLFTPFIDETTADLADAVVRTEELGLDDKVDILYISFSATDYIGHAYGPNSLEAEDNLIRLDKTLNRLLSNLDKSVGLNKTGFILTSDHGIKESPEFYIANQLTSAGRHDIDDIIKKLNAILKSKYQIEQDLITDFWSPGLYVDEDLLLHYELDITDVERTIASSLLNIPGFSRAFTKTQLMQHAESSDAIENLVKKSFHEKRSGHVLIVQEPLWYLYSSSNKYAAMHGSPYKYDRHVPMIFVLPDRIKEQKEVHHEVDPRDIAATLANHLHIPFPSKSSGKPLADMFQNDLDN